MRVPAAWTLWLAAAWAAPVAAVDLNSASRAELEALGGVGTALAARVVEERARRPFTDWADARRRVNGLGPKLAARLSEQGLTVNGAPFTPGTPTEPAKIP
jgi:competence protein ComEA